MQIETLATSPPRRKPREHGRKCQVEGCNIELKGEHRRQVKYCRGHRYYDVNIATSTYSANCAKGMHERCKAVYRPCACKCHLDSQIATN